MTDKELLKKAAKAAGIDHPDGEHSRYDDGRLWDCNGLRWWNPLTDDGDALRLAVKLNMDIVFDFDRVIAVYGDGYSKEEYFYDLPNPTDRLDATRKAIVRAAAEIGKARLDGQGL